MILMRSKAPNGQGSGGWVIQNGKKYWRITITIGNDLLTGKQKRKKIYGKTQKEAKSKLKVYEENYVPNNDNTILGDFYYDWLWNIKKQELRPSSFQKYFKY